MVSADTLTTAIHLVFEAMHAEGATAQSVIQALHSPGSCERFALVEAPAEAGDPTVICLRGEVFVDLGGAGSSKFTWPPGATWVTGKAYDVTAIRVSLDQGGDRGAVLPLEAAIVRATDVATSAATHPIVRLPAMERHRKAREEYEAQDEVIPVSPPPASPPAPPHIVPAHEEPSEDETVVVAELIRRPQVPTAHDLRKAAAVGTAAAEGLQPLTSLDMAPRKVDLSSLQAPPSWVLRLPDGNELEPSTPIVVGRRPWRTDPDETTTYYILAPSPGKQISGKHLEFAVVGDELTARDLESTNGTLVLTPQKPPRLLHGGGSVTLSPGDTLDLGEGFTIEVGEKR